MAGPEHAEEHSEIHRHEGIRPEAGVIKGPPGFTSGVFALSGGAIVAHVLAFASTPVIARLFAPEAFGAAEVLIATMMVIGIIASLRYESAIMLPGSDAQAANLLVLCSLSVVGVTALTFLGVGLFGDEAAEFLNIADLRAWKWLIPVGVLTWGLGFPLKAWCTRHRYFRQLGALSVAETFTSVTSRIGAGSFGMTGAGSLFVTGVLARTVPTVVMLYKLTRHDAGFISRHLRWSEMFRLGRRYVRFPLIGLWSSLIRQVNYYIPAVLLAASLGTPVAGFYKLAMLSVQLPLLLIGNAVGQVFFQRAAAQQAAGDGITKLVEQVTERLIWVSLLPLAVVAMIGPELFSLVLGARWASAGTYAQVLTIWLFFAGIATPLSGLINVMERLGGGLVFQVAQVTMQVAALIVGGWILTDAMTTVLLLGISGAAINAVLCCYLLRLSGVSLVRAGAFVVRYAAFALPTLAVGAAGKWLLDLPPWAVLAVVATASLSYWALVLVHDRWARSLVWNAVRRLKRHRKS